MSLRRLTIATLGVASLALVGCSDDDLETAAPPVDPEVPDGGLATSGDFAVIAARGANDEPYALDIAALDQDLATRFGGMADEPLDIDDDEDAVTVAGRGR